MDAAAGGIQGGIGMKNGVFAVGVDPSNKPDTHHEFTVTFEVEDN